MNDLKNEMKFPKLFDKDSYLYMFMLYKSNKINKIDLYEWNCMFLNVKSDEKNEELILKECWAACHQMEEEENYATTEEEIDYLLECLKGESIFSQEQINNTRLIGMSNRFKNQK